MGTTETRETTATKLARIAKLSASDRFKRFDSLMHLFNEESLAACFHGLDGKKAVGVDGVRKVESAQSTTIVQLGAICLVHQGSSAAKGEGLSCAVLIPP